MARPRFIFLDFDGVVMDSMELKLDSYCYAFDGCGFSRAAIRKLQLASAGMSRYKTIPLMYESLAGEPMPEALYREAVARFGEHDEASRGKMKPKRGTEEFLRAAKASGVPLAIVTGTPQDAIERTVEHFHLKDFFLRVCGVPGSKIQHLERMLGEFGLAAAETVFVGDAIKDQEAASALRIPFIGVNNGDDPFQPEGLVAEIRGLDQLCALLDLAG